MYSHTHNGVSDHVFSGNYRTQGHQNILLDNRLGVFEGHPPYGVEYPEGSLTDPIEGDPIGVDDRDCDPIRSSLYRLRIRTMSRVNMSSSFTSVADNE